MADPAGRAECVIWFRRDLRLADQAAVQAAVAGGRRVVGLFVLEAPAGPWAPGAASRWWLHHSLAALAGALAARGGTLVLRRGAPAAIVPALAAEVGATAVHALEGFEPHEQASQRAVAAALAERGVALLLHPGALLTDPRRLRTQSGGAFSVYTPFARAAFASLPPLPDVPAPRRVPAPERPPPSEPLESWALLPRRPDWSGGLRAAWTPGEAGAAARLSAFLAGALARYGAQRDVPGAAGTSRLSPHLHWGEISPRQVWNAAAASGAGAGLASFQRELLWREFSAYLLFHHPDLPERPLRPEFASFPWVEERSGLAAWRHGRTGVPIVDAGMRELWQSGWMHNRVRMIVASYLVKHLLVPWQEGEAWFWDTLVDADLAANAASWQWVAGCGADAAPYFRIFNPVLQGRKFDPDGAYVRRFVPELAALPDALLHAPWEAPPLALAEAGVRLGGSYPRPLIDLAAGRARALASFASLSGSDA